jgi:hypothetical protein
MSEFLACAMLRSGHRLQWLNILRELTGRNLNFNCYEVYAFIMQTAWQVGPLDENRSCREAHIDLEEERFGHSLLAALNDALDAIETNWLHATAARTFVALASRLLSLSTHEAITRKCFCFLRKARAILLRWTREVRRKMQQELTDEERQMLNARLLEIAMICHLTFDVDPRRITSLLEREGDLGTVIECSIIIHERRPARTEDQTAWIIVIWYQYQRLSCVLEPLLRQRILESNSDFDRTIGLFWAGYVPGTPGTALKVPNERWLITETSSGGGFPSAVVHYNLLDGSLLVNGLPLSRLPQSYEAHLTFQRLFGKVPYNPWKMTRQ